MSKMFKVATLQRLDKKIFYTKQFKDLFAKHFFTKQFSIVGQQAFELFVNNRTLVYVLFVCIFDVTRGFSPKQRHS